MPLPFQEQKAQVRPLGKTMGSVGPRGMSHQASLLGAQGHCTVSYFKPAQAAMS